MKKPVVFFLTALLVTITVSVGFATGQREGGAAKPVLVVDSRLWSPPEEQEFVINNVLKDFETQNDCTIDFSIVNDNDMLKRAKVQQSTNHVSTDVIIAYVAKFPEWVKNGYVDDLTSYVASWKDRTFSKGFEKLTIFDGKQYFLPIGADVYLLAANKKALKYLPSGVDVQNITWKQVVDWAIAIKKGEGVGKFAWTGVPQKMLIYQFGSMVLSYGGGFPDVDSAGAIKAWQQAVRLQHAFTPAVKTYDNVVPAMKRGEAWLTVTHNARVGQIYESNPNQFVIAPAPIGPAGRGAIAGTSGLAIMKNAPHKALAVKFLEYMTRPDIMLKLMKGTGGFIPPIDECIKLLGTSVKDEVIKKSLIVLNQGVLSFVPGAQFKDWGAVKLVVDKAFNQLVLVEGAVDKAYLAKAAKEIDALRK